MNISFSAFSWRLDRILELGAVVRSIKTKLILSRHFTITYPLIIQKDKLHFEQLRFTGSVQGPNSGN